MTTPIEEAPWAELARGCAALAAAAEANDWDRAAALMSALDALTTADRAWCATHDPALPERRAAIVAARASLEAAGAHLLPAHASLKKLLRAWGALPPT
ncbi:MAG: hypothetical protein PHF02_00435 [Tepidiphilus sp.]|jgi:hypothetical protein|uniref:Flagellar protein FliT n=1 Tax=Tepidiphilus baoligensis TaxID=2698687 RepID=A0ABX1QMP3_9PROT|nr:hypothetical protein [Tepidiphilus baoligensis]MDD2407291.1 hypothetical protein [Tepidiphilus sp.]MDD3432600.1 hypothetical protein [Tepidiphilus sp.]NMH16684.1 hypothetical protein [Tepidiphilus baoligensis]